MKTNTNDLLPEAESIIKKLSLIEILNRYGEVRVVGSVALNLIVKRDIDIHVVVQSNDSFLVTDQICHALLDQNDVKHIRISDYRENGGIKIGIDSYPGSTGDWSIDLWVTNLTDTTGFALVDQLNQRLTDEQRKVIFEIKDVLHSKGKLQDGISARIYTAVVDDGIRTIDEFEEMLGK